MYSPTLRPALSTPTTTPSTGSACSTEAASIAARFLRQLFAHRPRQETSTTLRLPAGSTYALPTQTADAEIELVGGILWITREGDTQDHVLSRKGQRLTGNLRQHIILQPTADAEILLRVR